IHQEMFRLLAVVALVSVASADDSMADFAAIGAKIQSAISSFDPAFVQKLQEIGKNHDISRNQKIAQINEAIAALPADQQEKANKFKDFGIKKEQEMIALVKSMIPSFSSETQAVINNIVSTYENGADTPCKQLIEKITAIYNGASDAAKKELTDAKAGLLEKAKDFAKSLIPAN
ncbi:hypothetical protein PMAYCL1PPCAC_17304, partial [Pristionchus mayeri]